jgi:SAM-dependent methyltransferase
MAIEKRREYDSYEDYKEHQMEKTSWKWWRKRLSRQYKRKVKKFQKRFSSLSEKGYIEEGKKVVCLGARMGEEVEAFENLGLEAIGVDLVPKPPRVIKADFNHLPFEDGSFDVVFSNSFDHSFDAEMFFKSCERVLKVGGYLVLDITPGEKMFGDFEVTYVGSDEDVKNDVCKNGTFEFVEKYVPQPRLYPVACYNPELVFKRV